MSDISDLVVGIVALNSGRLVSKIRLQKTVYLLEECGLGSSLDFDYRYYGPFSAEVAQAADAAADAGRLCALERPGFHAVPYTVFETKEEPPKQLGELSAVRAQKLLKLMDGCSAVILELAATIAFLRRYDLADDPVEKVKLLKPLKATRERLEKALQLHRALGLKEVQLSPITVRGASP